MRSWKLEIIIRIEVIIIVILVGIILSSIYNHYSSSESITVTHIEGFVVGYTSVLYFELDDFNYLDIITVKQGSKENTYCMVFDMEPNNQWWNYYSRHSPRAENDTKIIGYYVEFVGGVVEHIFKVNDYKVGTDWKIIPIN